MRFALVLLLFVFSFVPFVQAAEKTPADVFVQVQYLAQNVQSLRNHNNIHTPWPHVAVEPGRKPSHVFQKTLEILDKINRYRINIVKTGGITIPRFPGRDISPNEVYSVVFRLRQEMELLSPNITEEKVIPGEENVTPSEVYAALSEISLALDETLGIRGITPSDVYRRSVMVLNLARFLRQSQNMPLNVAKPKKSKNKLPNHALKSVNVLLHKVHRAELNLWMDAIKVPQVPRRVISPSDVYDAMGLVLAELQRIQYRLGLERDFEQPEVSKGKTPDDVIQNTRWATALLPEFSLNKTLRQYDRRALVKTPNHVYSVSQYILTNLEQYLRSRGIPLPIYNFTKVNGMLPQHVYSKTLELLDKINLIRQQKHLGEVTVPRYPLRKITPSEVFNQALRVDEELAIIYKHEGIAAKIWLTQKQIKHYQNKTPSDVFYNMQKISLLLDTILGGNAFSPNDVYQEMMFIENEVTILAKHLKLKLPDYKPKPLDINTQPRDTFMMARKILSLILKIKQRAGMFDIKDTSIPVGDNISPSEVYNQVRVITSELTSLKVFLSINILAQQPPESKGKTAAHVLSQMNKVKTNLEYILQTTPGEYD